MNGPEHYREAERLLKLLDTHPNITNPEQLFVEAQVHATLALAAATAMADTDAMREADYKAWKAAAGCPASDGDVR